MMLCGNRKCAGYGSTPIENGKSAGTAPAMRPKAAMTRLFYYDPFHCPPRRIGPLADKNFIESYLSQLRPDVVL